MKTLKFLFVIALIFTATNSYASWNKRIEVKGNGSLTGRTNVFSPGRLYLANAYNITGRVNVRIEWQKNFLLLWGGDGLANSSVIIRYNEDITTDVDLYQEQFIGKKVRQLSGYGNSIEVYLLTMATGWIIASASFTLYY